MEKTKVGLIVRPYGEKQAAGLGRAIFALAKGLIESDRTKDFVFFVKGKNCPKPDISGSNWRISYLPAHLFWLDAGLRSEKRQDVYIFFTPVMPFFALKGKSIVVAHDFAYKYIPARSLKQFIISFVLHFIHGRSLRRADKVVAISSYTKEEIVKHFKISPDKIEVVYNGFNPPKKISENNRQKDYFLFVGVIKERKNVLSLVKAYALYCKQTGEPADLVLVGKYGGSYFKQIQQEISLSGLEKRVIIKGYVSNQELDELYEGALAFVFPSLIEGFGLPVLEAMSRGVPVVTSNQGALKEVAGGAALLVDVNDIDSIAGGLTSVSTDSNLREELIRKGYERQKNFSWEKAVAGYIEVVNKVCSDEK